MRSMPCPIARTFGESSGKVRRSTLRITFDSRAASRSVGLGFQCVYQSTTGTPSGRASGAASTA